MEDCNGLCRTNAEHLERHTQGIGCVGSTQFMKHDEGKEMYHLIPPECLKELAKHLTYGAIKYKQDNWKKVDSTDRYYNALMRHLEKMRAGETFDEDNKRHSVAVFTNAMFLLWFDIQNNRGEE